MSRPARGVHRGSNGQRLGGRHGIADWEQSGSDRRPIDCALGPVPVEHSALERRDLHAEVGQSGSGHVTRARDRRRRRTSPPGSAPDRGSSSPRRLRRPDRRTVQPGRTLVLTEVPRRIGEAVSAIGRIRFRRRDDSRLDHLRCELRRWSGVTPGRRWQHVRVDLTVVSPISVRRRASRNISRTLALSSPDQRRACATTRSATPCLLARSTRTWRGSPAASPRRRAIPTGEGRDGRACAYADDARRPSAGNRQRLCRPRDRGIELVSVQGHPCGDGQRVGTAERLVAVVASRAAATRPRPRRVCPRRSSSCPAADRTAAPRRDRRRGPGPTRRGTGGSVAILSSRRRGRGRRSRLPASGTVEVVAIMASHRDGPSIDSRRRSRATRRASEQSVTLGRPGQLTTVTSEERRAARSHRPLRRARRHPRARRRRQWP